MCMVFQLVVHLLSNAGVLQKRCSSESTVYASDVSQSSSKIKYLLIICLYGSVSRLMLSFEHQVNRINTIVCVPLDTLQKSEPESWTGSKSNYWALINDNYSSTGEWLLHRIYCSCGAEKYSTKTSGFRVSWFVYPLQMAEKLAN